MKTPQARSLTRAMFLALILTFGAQAVWLVGIGVPASIVSQWGAGNGVNESLAVTLDGRILIQQYDYTSQIETYSTLDGNPVAGFASRDEAPGAYLGVQGPEVVLLTWFQRITGFSDDNRPATFWYLIHDPQPSGSAYLVGYDFRSGQRVGFIGRDGFHSDVPAENVRFAMPIRRESINDGIAANYHERGRQPRSGMYFVERVGTIFLLTTDGVLRIDLNDHKVTPVPIEGPAVDIALASEPRPDEPRSALNRYLAVRGPDRVDFLDEKGKTVHSFPIPSQLRNTRLVVHLWWTDRALFIGNIWESNPRLLCWVDSQGNVSGEQEVVLRSRAEPTPREQSWAAAGLGPSLLAVALVLLFSAPVTDVLRGTMPGYSQALSSWLSAGWPALLAVCVLGAALAVIAYRRQQGTSRHSSICWASFVFVLGLPGLVGYLLHRRWPVREKCSNCGSVTPRDRDECMSCDAPFPLPPLKGIELYA